MSATGEMASQMVKGKVKTRRFDIFLAQQNFLHHPLKEGT